MNIVIYSIILFVLIIAALVVTAYIFKFLKEFISNKKNIDNVTQKNINNQKETTSKNMINSDKSVLSPYIKQIEECINMSDNEIKTYLADLLSVMNKMNDFICSHRDKEDDINIMAEYYIPEMIKHIKEYYSLKENGLAPSSQAQLKDDLIKTITIIQKAYETVLSEFHESAVLTVSSSLEALKADIKMKGLA